MARIRSIKPEFPQSETIGKLSRDARLLFIQLWTLADDLGRTRAASRMLASLLYPYDDDAPKLIDGWLGELEAVGCIEMYVVDGSTYLQIANWLKHQRIDHPSASKIPPPPERISKAREDSRRLAPDRIGKERIGEEKKEHTLTSFAVRARKSKPPDAETDAAFERWWEAYPRRVGKGAAIKAYRSAAKKASPDQLIAAVQQASWGTDPRFIPYPASWLNGERWKDEPPISAPEPRVVGLF